MQKTTLLILAAACALPACSTLRTGHTPAGRIAKDMSLPGKGVDGQCLPFAQALHQRFRSAGIPSKVIVFRYESLGRMPSPFSNNAAYGLPRPQSGAHAIVAYDDGGRIYVTDNQTWMPQWVQGGEADALARQFSGMNHLVTEARVADPQNERKGRGLAAARAREAKGSRTGVRKSVHGVWKSRAVAAKNGRAFSTSRALAKSRAHSAPQTGKMTAKAGHRGAKSHAAAVSTTRSAQPTRKGKSSPTKVVAFRSRVLALR